MNKLTLSLLVLLALGCRLSAQKLDNPFYAFNNSVRTLQNAPEGMVDQARLIKELGYDGLSGHHIEDYFKRRKAMDKVGLAMPEIYLPVTIHRDGSVFFKEEIREIIKDSKERNLIVALAAHSKHFKNNMEEGDPYLVKAIQELADYALPYGVRIAVYPHGNFYCERFDHSVKICREANRPNVGAIFNTMHLFMVEGMEGWEQKLKDDIPYLYMISINGLDSGDTQNMGSDRMIQPLGEGTFDTYKIVKVARDNGYNGPFGLQCYNMKQDCRIAMTKSMNTWKSYIDRYEKDSRELIRFSMAVENGINTPVSIPLDMIDYNLDTTALVLYQVDNSGETRIASQVEPGISARLWFVMEARKGQEVVRHYVLRLEEKPDPVAHVITLDQDLTDICIKQYDKPVLKYRIGVIYPPDSAAPEFQDHLHKIIKHGAYIHPLWSPGGEVLTQIQPADHPHHFGLWGSHNYAHIGERKVNFWDLRLGMGTVKFEGFTSKVEGEVFGGFEAVQNNIDFGAAGEDQIAISELLDVRSWNTGEGTWMVDYTTTMFTDLSTGVQIDQFRYGSGIGLRATRKWNVNTCKVLTSEGKILENADASTGRWCIMEGISDTEEGRSGVLFLSHPSNFGHPEPFRIWPKPEHGAFFNFTPVRNKAWRMEPNTPYAQKYRMIVFDGEMTAERAEKYWQAFAKSPLPRLDEK